MKDGTKLEGPEAMHGTHMKDEKETRFGGTGNGVYPPTMTPGAKIPEWEKPSAVTTKSPY